VVPLLLSHEIVRAGALGHQAKEHASCQEQHMIQDTIRNISLWLFFLVVNGLIVGILIQSFFFAD
jgi:hypothetical protein